MLSKTMCKQDCCCKGCCHGSTCNKVLRVFSLIICILSFFIHCAAAGHTEWMCAKTSSLWGKVWFVDGCAVKKRSLFHEITSLLIFTDYQGGADGGYLGACAAFAILALLSSFMAIIFICIRMCKIHKITEIFTLLFIFGAVGAEFLTWVIYVAVRAEDLDKGWRFGQGLNCSIASMVLSFIVFVLTAVSVKMSGCKPIVSKGGNEQVVVVQAQPAMVVVGGGQPQQYAQPQGQAPPAYAEPQKQPVY